MMKQKPKDIVMKGEKGWQSYIFDKKYLLVLCFVINYTRLSLTYNATNFSGRMPKIG